MFPSIILPCATFVPHRYLRSQPPSLAAPSFIQSLSPASLTLPTPFISFLFSPDTNPYPRRKTNLKLKPTPNYYPRLA
ncbi:hypothetical protein B0T18DRAFT_405449 [Schizothecium vesticola]|uniref:Uncharacterized protein n=1 Tax=Schizothecium vesticola TaxID=314040 RepID=A0AA40F0I9_9PEZI|nr:hypothetical protein B0T18DRAFT_405449 [Schizothecium vesticola]